MDFEFKLSGVMSVDVVNRKIYNQTEDGVFEFVSADGKLYNLVLAVEVFDMESNETSFIVGDENLRAAGFNVYDYSDQQWESKESISEISSEGVLISELN